MVVIFPQYYLDLFLFVLIRRGVKRRKLVNTGYCCGQRISFILVD